MHPQEVLQTLQCGMSTTFQKVDTATLHIEIIEMTVQAITMEAAQEKEPVARAMGGGGAALTTVMMKKCQKKSRVLDH
jgi:riboflavin synthase alpha subunit